MQLHEILDPAAELRLVVKMMNTLGIFSKLEIRPDIQTFISSGFFARGVFDVENDFYLLYVTIEAMNDGRFSVSFGGYPLVFDGKPITRGVRRYSDVMHVVSLCKRVSAAIRKKAAQEIKSAHETSRNS